MISKLIVVVAFFSVAICKPQLITLKDGNVGVNFAGFTAQAGLGGLLTGNAAHGGLSASAGTPYGQRAAAGIGGSLDGQTLGGAYAGATAGNGIGASAGLGGVVGGGGGLMAESHAGGISKSVIKTISADEQPPVSGQTDYYARENRIAEVDGQANVIQKIKPPKKYAPVISENHVVPTGSVVQQQQSAVGPDAVLQPTNFGTQQQPQTFIYHKRIRPYRRRFHYRKQFAPINYYQSTNVQDIGTRFEHPAPAVPTYQAPVHVNKRKDVFINTSPVTGSGSVHSNIAVGSGFFDSIFNIPIATLRAVNGFLNQGLGGGIAVRKTVDVQHH